MNNIILSCNNISFGRGDHILFDNLSFDIQQQTTVAIVGPSGVGKTTLLKALGGAEVPLGGSISYAGSIITDANRKQHLQDHVGMVFQDYTLFPWMTISQNIAIGMISNAQQNSEKVSFLLQRIGLKEYADYYPHQISGGMKQRVAIARTLINDSPILLLDEPFSALDYLTKHTMQKFIQSIQYEFCKTIVFVTHHIEDAYMMADKVIVLKNKGTRIKEFSINHKHRRVGDEWYQEYQQNIDFLSD